MHFHKCVLDIVTSATAYPGFGFGGRNSVEH